MPIRTIAFFNWRYPYGGGEVVTFNLARFFRGSGFRVLLYTGELFREKIRTLDTETFEFRTLPAPGGCKSKANEEFLIESIRQEKVDVVIVQGVMEFPGTAIRQGTSCKVIFCLHNQPFWEVRLLRGQKASQIPHPTLARRIEYLLLRKPLYWLTPKLKKRTLKSYARLLRSVDKCVLLCEEYRRDFDAALKKIRALALEYADAHVALDEIFAGVSQNAGIAAYSPDGVHPTHRAERLIADNVIKKLAAFL